jgi:hypothetical protein
MLPPEDVRRLVDIEADLDEGQLSQVRFGRRRFLRTMGLALFGLTTGMVAVQGEAAAVPVRGGCNRAPTCKDCDTTTGTCSGCRGSNGDGTAGCCWWASSNAGGITTCYQCCDYIQDGKLCVCPKVIAC